MKIQVVIADDHALFRKGMIELLKKFDDIDVVKGVSDGVELMELLKNMISIDVILLDLTMPNMDGVEVLKKLALEYPGCKSIILSMHDDGNYITQCAQLGAYGYLLKNTDEEELIKAIRLVHSGRKYFSPEISERMINFMTSPKAGSNIFSNKESEILSLLSDGLTSKEIAAMLFISARTVETHRANMLAKLEVKNTAELIKKAAEYGYL